jgi:hypothetical protein
MSRRAKPALQVFDKYLIDQVERSGDEGVPQFDVIRPWLQVAPYTSLKYRVERLGRRGEIRIRTVGRGKLLLPANKTATEEVVG